jgi:hypothetical protein
MNQDGYHPDGCKPVVRMSRLSIVGPYHARFPRAPGVFLLLMATSLPSLAQVAPSGAQGELGPGGTGTLVVSVRSIQGATLPSLATVNVYTQSHQHTGTATVNEGSARFPDLLLGTYIVEASCPGYETTREEVELRLRNDLQQVLLALRPPWVAALLPSHLGHHFLLRRYKADSAKHWRNCAVSGSTKPARI